ncbi:MAG TPA: peptide ABC transporter, partial [Agrobacterium sp.]|nr:peptide ABC transporter [Agrobacterium sp.]
MTDATIAAPAVAATPVQSALADIWKQFRAHKGGVAGLFVFIFILLAVFVGPYIHTVAPNAINVRERNQWPSL